MNTELEQYQLRLYLSGSEVQADVLLKALRQALSAIVDSRYELEVIDVLSDPARASTDGVIATPTLVMSMPEPERRAIGSLDQVDQVLLVLGLGDDQAS